MQQNMGKDLVISRKDDSRFKLAFQHEVERRCKVTCSETYINAIRKMNCNYRAPSYNEDFGN